MVGLLTKMDAKRVPNSHPLVIKYGDKSNKEVRVRVRVKFRVKDESGVRVRV